VGFVHGKMDSIAREDHENYYREVMGDLKRCIEMGGTEKAEVEQDEWPVHSVTLTNNLIRDRLLFCSAYLGYCHALLRDEPSLKNRLILNLTHFLASTYSHYQPLNQKLGNDIISSFIASQEPSLKKAASYDMGLALSKIFERILPDCYLASSKTQGISSNAFLEFMI
jgi:hypothetical protein